MECLTDQEVRSTIKFSGMFGDKTYAQLTPINELRRKLEWLYTTYPHTIPEYIHTKINTHVRSTEPIMNKKLMETIILGVVSCTILGYGMILLKYVVDIMADIGMVIKMYIKMYGQLLLFCIVIYYSGVALSASTQSSTLPPNDYTPSPKYKKQSISSTLKRKVWDTHIGQTIGQHKCLCCNLTEITQLSFHCGHIIPESKGGDTTLTNLRPICQNCNSSMGTKNMIDFMNAFH